MTRIDEKFATDLSEGKYGTTSYVTIGNHTVYAGERQVDYHLNIVVHDGVEEESITDAGYLHGKNRRIVVSSAGSFGLHIQATEEGKAATVAELRRVVKGIKPPIKVIKE